MGTGRVAFVSDLHVMSRYGIVPPDWQQRGDPLVPLQRYLWKCWTHFVRVCPPVDVLVVVGDLREGTFQVRGEPRGNVSDDAADQNKVAADVLRPLAQKAKKVMLVRGTPFHEGGDAVEAVGERLNAEKWASGGRYSSHMLNLKFRDLLMNISHHNTRGWQWIGGAVSRMAVLAAAAESVAKLPHADVIVRGDLHTFFGGQTLDKHVVLLPGWTMPNPHTMQKMEAIRAYLATDIGAVVLTVSDAGVAVKPFTYPLFRMKETVA